MLSIGSRGWRRGGCSTGAVHTIGGWRRRTGPQYAGCSPTRRWLVNPSTRGTPLGGAPGVGERTKPRKERSSRAEGGQAAERSRKPLPSDGGISHDPEFFDKVMWAGGFTLTGEEADEGSNEPWRSPRLLNPKSYVSLFKTT